MGLTRRQFVKGLAGAAAGLGLPSVSQAGLRGANEDLRVAVIGLRSRGRAHVDAFERLAGVRVAAVCDVDTRFLDRTAAELAERGRVVRRYRDARRLLEARDVDAVSIATPNHWHALLSVWACQAGKDVYVEKPVSHDVREGRLIVQAARKHGRIVQTGTQSRSNPGIRDAVRFLHEGRLGRVLIARGLCYKPRGSIGRVAGPQPVPKTVDYDLWTGPAPLVPLRRRRLHYDWHWVWPTGNGDLGNQGVHQMDIARWALGEAALPPVVWSLGGRLGYEDDGETPNTQIAVFGYEKAPLVFEVRGLPRERGAKRMDELRGVRIGVIVECERGSVVFPSYDRAVAYDAEGTEVRRFSGSDDHFADFVAAVRSRRRQDLAADIAEGHLSSALCHVANVSHRTGSGVPFDELELPEGLDARMPEALSRLSRHLAANGLPADTRVVAGRRLAIDPATERFRDDADADALLHREPRPPFVFPEVL